MKVELLILLSILVAVVGVVAYHYHQKNQAKMYDQAILIDDIWYYTMTSLYRVVNNAPHLLLLIKNYPDQFLLLHRSGDNVYIAEHFVKDMSHCTVHVITMALFLEIAEHYNETQVPASLWYRNVKEILDRDCLWKNSFLKPMGMIRLLETLNVPKLVAAKLLAQIS